MVAMATGERRRVYDGAAGILSAAPRIKQHLQILLK